MTTIIPFPQIIAVFLSIILLSLYVDDLLSINTEGLLSDPSQARIHEYCTEVCETKSIKEWLFSSEQCNTLYSNWDECEIGFVRNAYVLAREEYLWAHAIAIFKIALISTFGFIIWYYISNNIAVCCLERTSHKTMPRLWTFCYCNCK